MDNALATLIQRHTERMGCDIFCRETIDLCIGSINKKWRQGGSKIPTTLQVANTTKNAKKETETFLARSINASTPWKAFYTTEAASGLEQSALDNVEEKAEAYRQYLVGRPKSKYRLLQLPQEVEWFSLICLLSAILHSLEWRHNPDRFYDPDARQRIGRLLTRREENVALAKGWGHAKKHDEDAQTALTSVFDAFQSRINETFFPPYTEELPPLPQGIVLPLDSAVKLLAGKA